MTKSNELCKTSEYHRFLIILKLKTSCDCLKQYFFDLLIAISKENNKNVKAETRAHLSTFIQQGQKYFLRGKSLRFLISLDILGLMHLRSNIFSYGYIYTAI